MSFSSLPRAGSILTAAVLAATLAGCGGSEIGPDKMVSIIEIFPKSAQLYSVGQQVTFTADITTEAGTSGSGIEVGFVARDKTLLEVTSAGVAKALKKGGSTYVVVTAGGKSDSALVEVPLTTCGSVTPTVMTAGQVVTDIGDAGFCSAASEGNYTVIVHNNSLAASGSSVLELTGLGLGTAPSGAVLSRATTAATTPSASFGAELRRWRRDVAAEMRHRRNEAATVAPFAAGARKWYESRKNRASFAAAPPVVGDPMTINVAISGADGCTGQRNDQVARVAAVSNSAIVLTDPRNPAGGFTDAEYNEFAQLFDSVINPLATAQFGAPSDMDANQRVLLVFTKSVNDRTPAGSGDFVSGLTHSRDLLPRGSCAGSNEAEMFYLFVPDPTHPIFTKSFVSQFVDVTVIHEYQHLINFSRRRYILPATVPTVDPIEELWLNEGLSHIAEDLLFYRRTGRASRTNITGPDVNGVLFTPWVFYSSGNFLGYDEYMAAATVTSPFEAGDAVASRGATAAFLRYLADHRAATDGTLWFDLVNSGQSGVTNLLNRLGITSAQLLASLRDFTVSTYTDDFVPGVPVKYTQPSWNMRSIYPILLERQPNANPPWIWPQTATGLKNAEMASLTLQAGGFRVYRFKGLAGADSFIRVKGLAGTAAPAGTTISIVRTQ